MADLKIIYEQEQKEQRRLSEAFRMTFCNPYGEIVLTHLLNRLGYFATDPSVVKPELTSVANWILMELGVYSTNESLERFVGSLLKTAKGEE